jgi:hypothetical protein
MKRLLLMAHGLLSQMSPLRAGLGVTVFLSLSMVVPASGQQTTAPPAKEATATSTALPRVFKSAMPRSSFPGYPWRNDIQAGVTVIGKASAWDGDWQSHYGGPDPLDAKSRTVSYGPAAFIPKLNPFYVALPYNDVSNASTTKPEAATKIPWFKESFTLSGQSVLKDRWVAIRFGNRVVYAQWEDCGPRGTDDVEYVFGNARPKNRDGMDVSPAVRDYLGLGTNAKVDNPFTRAVVGEKSTPESRLEELRRQRDEYLRQNGKAQ